MDRCPSELWTHIFGLACTDGGITGCSVGLVSRYFHEAVLPVQLYSVALYGATKIVAFADLLEQRQPTHRQVRHLFLASATPRTANKILFRHSELDKVLFRILATVAPDLLTLASTKPQRFASKHDALSFPRLTELTLDGHYFYPTTPALRYLHVRNLPCIDAALDASRIPALTHLRLSDMSIVQKQTHEMLKRLFAGSESADQDQASAAEGCLLPLSILRVVIYPLKHEFDPWMDIQLHVLMSIDKEKKLEIESNGNARNIRDDWEDRITGGYGCWSERVERRIPKSESL